jgi:hypothetical protein
MATVPRPRAARHQAVDKQPVFIRGKTSGDFFHGLLPARNRSPGLTRLPALTG